MVAKKVLRPRQSTLWRMYSWRNRTRDSKKPFYGTLFRDTVCTVRNELSDIRNRLRDMAQETEQDQRKRIAELEKDVVGLSELQCNYSIVRSVEQY